MFWIVLGTIVSWYFLCCDGSCKPPISGNVSQNISLGNWSINDEPNFRVTSKDQLTFKRNEGNFLAPLSASLDSAFLATTSYLKGNASRKLNITGYYHYNEVNPDSTWANLGMTRANMVKNHLVNLGIPANQIDTDGKILDGNWFNGDTLAKGVYFNFSDVINANPVAPTEPALGPSMSIYFNTNKANTSFSIAEKAQLKKLIDYLNKVPSTKVNVYGHTDNRGSKQLNLALSTARAEFAKNYLNRKGNIDLTKMDVQGFAFDQPSADNSTADGRAMNRRVDITLK